MALVVPLILAGGSGSRLWPLSRALFPKQFHPVIGEDSLLQSTLKRARAATQSDPIVICNEEHRFMVAEQAQAVGEQWLSLMLEPEGRNTAPAIALAAHRAVQEDPEAVLLYLPSDHLIRDLDGFYADVARAVQAAAQGKLVTFGVAPIAPETGYGYIEVASADNKDVQSIVSFVEKPTLSVAQEYLASGRFLWNSGMFVLHAQTYLDELARFQPEIADAAQLGFAEGQRDLDFFRPSAAFLDSPADSIDYAVMEKTTQSLVLPVDFGWNDVGSWAAVWDESERDAHGNHVRGDVLTIDSKNSYFYSKHRLIGAIGVEDLIVVETTDAVLISRRDRVQDVKEIVATLKREDREEYLAHTEVFRPWGSYETVEVGERYQVKRIKVKPGERLSLQLHHHRSEHWIVVRGTAEVQCGDQVFTLAENESTYIPLGEQHRLSNPGKLTLELIEVQVGAYLGEDDIVRLDDAYGRIPSSTAQDEPR